MGQASFGGQPLLDPVVLARDLRAQQTAGQLVDLSFWGKANGYRCPLGQEAGKGYLLLSRASLSALSLNAPQTLTFGLAASEILGVASTAQSVALQGLLFVRATCLAPDLRGEPICPYLCEITDKRHLARASVINAAYNMRATASASPGCYLSATLDSGTPWTWLQMSSNVWSAIPILGSFPGLPFTPNGTPEGFSFYGMCAYDALGVLMERLGCALCYNPLSGTFSVVQTGGTDATNAAALLALDGQRSWDSDPVESIAARLPANVRVWFPVQRTLPDATGDAPFYPVDTAGGDSGAQAGTYAALHDDMAALYDASNSLTNGAALAARAAERTADYYRDMRLTRLLRSYIGPRNSVFPGAQVMAATWHDFGDGYQIDVERTPLREDDWPLPPAPAAPTNLARRVLAGPGMSVRPTGPGDVGALVLGPSPSSSTAVALLTSSVNPGSGSAAGSGTADLQYLSGSTWTTRGLAAVIVYNDAPVRYASGTYVNLIWEPIDGVWVVTGEFISTWVGKLTSAVPAMSGSTPGTGTANQYTLVGGVLTLLAGGFSGMTVYNDSVVDYLTDDFVNLALDPPSGLSLITGPEPVFLAAGANHSPGLVPDPGATAHNPPYALTDAALFDKLVGAKGDLLTTQGTTLNQLAVGNKGQVLTVNPAALNGIDWENSPQDGFTIYKPYCIGGLLKIYSITYSGGVAGPETYAYQAGCCECLGGGSGSGNSCGIVDTGLSEWTEAGSGPLSTPALTLPDGCLLVVNAACAATNIINPTLSATFNGNAMTPIAGGNQNDGHSPPNTVAMFYLKISGNQTGTLVVTSSDAPHTANISASATYWQGLVNNALVTESASDSPTSSAPDLGNITSNTACCIAQACFLLPGGGGGSWASPLADGAQSVACGGFTLQEGFAILPSALTFDAKLNGITPVNWGGIVAIFN